VVESPASSKVVPLTDTDVVILAGLADESRRAGRSVRLAAEIKQAPPLLPDSA
jgi:hypothetical protein